MGCGAPLRGRPLPRVSRKKQPWVMQNQPIRPFFYRCRHHLAGCPPLFGSLTAQKAKSQISIFGASPPQNFIGAKFHRASGIAKGGLGNPLHSEAGSTGCEGSCSPVEELILPFRRVKNRPNFWRK